jgi:pimeloyl-ACP methyl ester carboxylesterase
MDGLGGLPPDGGWDVFDENFGKVLPDDIQKKVAALDEKLYAGEGTDEDSVEMMRLCWPYYFADPPNAPPMPPMKLSAEVYEQIHTSFRSLFDQGRPEKGIRSFSRPALFLHGEVDPMPLDPSRATARAMPNARFVTFENCGHFPWWEKPGSVRQAVESWLA